MSSSIVKYIEYLEIDKELRWTASKAVKGSLVFPDHYALYLKLRDIPMKNKLMKNSQKKIIWNTKKEGSWANYRQKTEINERFCNIAEIDDEDPKQVEHHGSQDTQTMVTQ